jgi:hypothetical protein
MNQNKIKIIFIIDNLNFGGAEIMLLDLVRRLSSEFFEVKVATVVRGGALVEDFRNAEISTHVFEKKGKIGFGVAKNPIVFTRTFLEETPGEELPPFWPECQLLFQPSTIQILMRDG